jgi:hypothetical protein
VVSVKCKPASSISRKSTTPPEAGSVPSTWRARCADRTASRPSISVGRFSESGVLSPGLPATSARGAVGYARDRSAPAPDPIQLERARTEAALHNAKATAKRLDLARFLWQRGRPIAGTITERYLVNARGCRGPFPATLRSLPGTDNHAPAMIAAFGMADEPDPGDLMISPQAFRGVHITKLLPDGSWRLDDEKAKFMIGHSAGSPIVLVPMNDGLALAITEGIEDGLSIHQSLGIGVWVAGAASRLPALDEVVPAYTDTVLVFAHDDRDGQRHAADLWRRLRTRMINTEIVTLASKKAAA